jgi:hypothetical protein
VAGTAVVADTVAITVQGGTGGLGFAVSGTAQNGKKDNLVEYFCLMCKKMLYEYIRR